DAALGVHGDAVGPDVVGPCPPVGQVAVGLDVERGQAGRERLADDQGGVVRGHDYAVREGEVPGHLADRTVRSDERDDTAGRLAPAGEVEGDAVGVDVAATVDHDLAPAVGADRAQVGVDDHRSVR